MSPGRGEVTFTRRGMWISRFISFVCQLVFADANSMIRLGTPCQIFVRMPIRPLYQSRTPSMSHNLNSVLLSSSSSSSSSFSSIGHLGNESLRRFCHTLSKISYISCSSNLTILLSALGDPSDGGFHPECTFP